MIMRVDPSAKRVAVLSFPRDLYVSIAGAGNKARINSAYRRDDPQRLIDTIYENFGVGTDHWIQVDFCTFKTLVDAVGGVTVPFEFAARDPNSGLNVPAPGCFTFDGDHALAYVRSRNYQYEDPPGSGNWQEDPSSDLGRISRQQDFLRRALTSVLNKGLLNPSVARGLIEAATGGDVVTSSELSLAKLMEFAGVLRDVAGGVDPLVPDRGRRRARSAAPTCSSRASRATTCRPCWRCSAARRRWPTPPCSRSSRRRRRRLGPGAATPDDGRDGHRRRRSGVGAGREQRRHRAAPRRPVPVSARRQDPWVSCPAPVAAGPRTTDAAAAEHVTR